jgi:hypothetical protein
MFALQRDMIKIFAPRFDGRPPKIFNIPKVASTNIDRCALKKKKKNGQKSKSEQKNRPGDGSRSYASVACAAKVKDSAASVEAKNWGDGMARRTIRTAFGFRHRVGRVYDIIIIVLRSRTYCLSVRLHSCDGK